MTRVVIDASVAAAAFLPEESSYAALKLLSAGHEMHVPGFIFAELGNVTWKRATRGEISLEEAAAMVEDLLQLPFIVMPSSELVRDALRLAMETKRTVYDCLYLALAVKLKTVLITLDSRLVNSLQNGPLAEHVSLITDYS